MSRATFEARSPDEPACARHLAQQRWLDGFLCSACGGRKGWALKRRPTRGVGMRRLWERDLGDRRHRHAPQPSAVEDMVHGHHIMTSHSNGISALQLQAQLGLGSYKTAWFLLHKLRCAMVSPDRACSKT